MKSIKQATLIFALLISVSLGATAVAQNVSGTVRNGTTGKVAAGVDVVLLDLSQGMTEAGTSKTDASGHFSLPLGGGQMPHLVRVIYQGANYFKMVPPGVSNADIEIYDAAKKIDAINGTVRVIRAQTNGNTLQVIELYAVANKSNPPRTLSGDNTFEFVLPDGATLDEANAQGPNGQPIQNMPSPTKQKNHYAFSYALRPGETRFQISYHMPYSGDVTFTPQNLIPFDHFVTVIPQSMQFEPKNAAQFSPMADQPGTTVQVATNVKPGQDLTYRIAGTGTITDEQPQQSGAPMGAQNSAAATQQRVGPGGGLGPPIDAPDPLAQYRWWILGGLGIVMAGGAYLATSRHNMPDPEVASVAAPVAKTARVAAPVNAPVSAPRTTAPAPAAPASNSDALLAAMKEELFQLEIERQKGQISQAEYEQAKAALDQTLKRALARASKN
jgi:hypothetical protein